MKRKATIPDSRKILIKILLIGFATGFLLSFIFKGYFGNYTFALNIIWLSPASLLMMYGRLEDGKFVRGLLWYMLSVIVLVFSFAAIFFETGLFDNNGNCIHELGTSIYFSLVTWTTLGYGDLHPEGSARFWAALAAFLGYIHMAVLAGLIFWRLTKIEK